MASQQKLFMPEEERKEESPLEPLVESYKTRPERTLSKPTIFADSREFQGDVVKELGGYDCVVKQKMLAVGDYLLSDRVCIERKTASDFLSSVMDGRLFSQIKSMRDNFERPILLIEGNFYDIANRDANPNVIRGALASIALDFALPIIWTMDPQESAGIIFWIARREQLAEKREVAGRSGKKETSTKKQQEFLISGLPGISIVRARSLLKKFKNPLAVFNAAEEELADTENLGPKTAKKIKGMLMENYK